MEVTDRLALPFILPGQAQKEVTHNEALQVLDAIVSGAVEGAPVNDPPPDPDVGSCFIVGSVPTGEWSQHQASIASFTSGGWRFIAPVEGMRLLLKDAKTFAVYVSGAWELGTVTASQIVVAGEQVVSTRASAIADPSGGSMVDSEARATLTEVLSALRHHGLISL